MLFRSLKWKLTHTGEFSVKSFYSLMQSGRVVPYRFLWKVKIPLRVRTFLWLVLKKSILTRDVLLHRGGECESKCLFCGMDESISHLFFLCPLARYIWNVVSCAFGVNCQFQNIDQGIAWLNGFGKKKRNILSVGMASIIWHIWKTRNAACFQGEWPVEPYLVIIRICDGIQKWCILQVSQDAKEMLKFYAKLLERVAKEVFGARRRWSTWTLKLTL